MESGAMQSPMQSPTVLAEESETPVESSPPERTEARIFRFSDYVHIGEGSATCDHATNGRCKDPDHFHAWIRLPNKFQITQIREKAQAARARVIRQAKDPETDRWEIVENQVAEAMSAGTDGAIAELLAREEWKLYEQARLELVNDDDEEGEGEDPRSPWADIEEDQARFAFLSQQPEAERDDDEYGELTRHLEAWNKVLDQRLEELRRPERERLEAHTEETLREMIRERAVGEQADGIYMRTFTSWQMVVCTLKPNGGRPREQVFGSPQHLQAESPEVIAGLEVAYNALESELSQKIHLRAEGN